MRETLGDRLQVHWRYFPLEQVNSAEGPDWKLWEQPDNHRSRGRPAFQAAIAARKQSEAAFERFHMALLRARHEQNLDHWKRNTLLTAAKEADLDLERFEREMTDRSLLAKIGEDYTEARDVHGVFGTPTFVFPNGAAAYLKMLPAAPPEDSVTIFDEFLRTVCDRPYIAEIKRPKKPSMP